MTEDEAWLELESQIARRNAVKTVDVTDLVQRAIDMERTACAQQYRKIMDDAIHRAILHKREACLAIVETHPTVQAMSIAIRARGEQA